MPPMESTTRVAISAVSMVFQRVLRFLARGSMAFSRKPPWVRMVVMEKPQKQTRMMETMLVMPPRLRM